MRSGKCLSDCRASNYGVVDVEVVVAVPVAPPAGAVLVAVVVVVWVLVVVSVPGAAAPVEVDVEVVEVSVLPLHAASEATIAKLAAARAIVFKFNVIELNVSFLPDSCWFEHLDW